MAVDRKVVEVKLTCPLAVEGGAPQSATKQRGGGQSTEVRQQGCNVQQKEMTNEHTNSMIWLTVPNNISYTTNDLTLLEC